MQKREFVKIMGLVGIGVASRKAISFLPLSTSKIKDRTWKQWTWVTHDTEPSVDDWKKTFAQMKSAGVDAILPEIYNSRSAYYGSKHLPVQEPWLEKILPLAKAEGLEVHAWMWSMPCNVEEVIHEHPEWYAVNRLGKSAAIKPAYVEYYKFLCPSRPEVWEFIQETVTELCQYKELDGVHLDYIRYPDVILPIKLQPRYHITQDHEYPQYDYCYCELCRHDFKEKTGKDPMKLDDPSSDDEWKQFRYNRVTHIVNDVLIPAAHNFGKKVTAAVFPNWENVRQHWYDWSLDGAMPMQYARFYNGGTDWIKEKTATEVKALNGSEPLYSGLAVSQLGIGDLTDAVKASYDAGSNGVCLFSAQAMTKDQWDAFSRAIRI